MQPITLFIYLGLLMIYETRSLLLWSTCSTKSIIYKVLGFIYKSLAAGRLYEIITLVQHKRIVNKLTDWIVINWKKLTLPYLLYTNRSPLAIFFLLSHPNPLACFIMSWRVKKLFLQVGMKGKGGRTSEKTFCSILEDPKVKNHILCSYMSKIFWVIISFGSVHGNSFPCSHTIAWLLLGLAIQVSSCWSNGGEMHMDLLLQLI